MSSGSSGREVVAEADRAAGRVEGADEAVRQQAAGVEELVDRAQVGVDDRGRVGEGLDVLAEVLGVAAHQLEPVLGQVGEPADQLLDARPLVGQHLARLRERVEDLAELLLAGGQRGRQPVEALDDATQRLVLLGERGDDVGERGQHVVERGAVAPEVLLQVPRRASRAPPGRGCRGTP